MDPTTKRRLALGAAALALGFSAMSLVAAESGSQPRTHTVTIDATSYQPRTLTVKVGDTVVWFNKDLMRHTATAKAGAFDSRDIDAGKSWTFTARQEGLFGYVCLYHPTMKGTLRVR